MNNQYELACQILCAFVRAGHTIDAPKQAWRLAGEMIAVKEAAAVEKAAAKLLPLKEAQLADFITLSVRAGNCLRRAGITTLAQLTEQTPAHLLGIRSFGLSSLNEVRTELGRLGMSLREKT
jgi:DNA-directed RNA polymerase subunit alpha